MRRVHCVDHQLDVHVAFDPATAASVDEFLGWLGYDGISIVLQPIDQRT
jgi:hypothetical protein